MAESFAKSLNTDADTLYDTGFYSFANQAGDYSLPFNYGILIVIRSKGVYPCIQICFNRLADATTKIAFRTLDAYNAWNNWSII